jgi:hypothetical protein
MDYDDVIRKSIKKFMSGVMPEETARMKDSGLMYTPAYFDDLEKEFLGDTKPKKKSKKDDVDEPEL